MKHSIAARSIHISRIPLFLVPACAESSVNLSFIRTFTSSTCLHERKRSKDMNRRRGVSAMRSTGLRKHLSVDRLYPELPTPRPEKERPLDEFPINPNHGLYGFFNQDKKVVLTEEEESSHGRSWEYKELMIKSFDDLHQLYWACILEGNQIATRYGEFRRLKLGYGDVENQNRAATVKETMKIIRNVLRDRQLAYEEARVLWDKHPLEELLAPKVQHFEEDEFSPMSENQLEYTEENSAAQQDIPQSEEVKRRNL